MSPKEKEKRQKEYKRWMKKRLKNIKIQEQKRMRNLELQNPLERGKWYKFTSIGSVACIYTKPDMCSKVIENVNRGDLVMFIELHPEVIGGGDAGYGSGWRFLKVGYKDVFGWLACYFEKEFMVHKHLRKINHL